MNLLKSFVCLLALMIFVGSAEAAAGNGLKEAFDEFQYAMSVEWDQKDASFFEENVPLKYAVRCSNSVKSSTERRLRFEP